MFFIILCLFCGTASTYGLSLLCYTCVILMCGVALLQSVLAVPEPTRISGKSPAHAVEGRGNVFCLNVPRVHTTGKWRLTAEMKQTSEMCHLCKKVERRMKIRSITELLDGILCSEQHEMCRCYSHLITRHIVLSVMVRMVCCDPRVHNSETYRRPIMPGNGCFNCSCLEKIRDIILWVQSRRTPLFLF